MADGNGSQIVFHQRDITGFDGHIRTRADGDADISRRQGRGIVDPVSDHGNHMPLQLQPLDLRRFIPRKNLRQDMINTQHRTNAPGCLRMIASHHGDLQSHFLQIRNGFCRRCLGNVEKTQHACCLIVFRYKNAALPF